MGIHSQVVVALKTRVYNQLSRETVGWLNKCDRVEAVPGELGGISFRWSFTKWGYCKSSTLLYEELDAIDTEDYLVLVACHDYPFSEEGDVGCWDENPWNYYKHTETTIEESAI